MKHCAALVWLATALALLTSPRAVADNECVGSPNATVSAGSSLAIESKTVVLGQPFSVGIAITNDISLFTVQIILVIREIDPGSYITTLSYPPSGRVPGGRLNLTNGALRGIKTASRYNVEDGTCKNGFPGGFTTPVSSSYAGPWSTPDGVKFFCSVMDPSDPADPPLLPGADPVTGSLQLLLTANDTPGQFEIDTTCCMPACHTEFIPWDGNLPTIIPEFTKGTITIMTCDCPHQGDLAENGVIDVSDVLKVIGIAFINGADTQDPGCPRTRGDVNNTGAVDVNDVLDIITTAFVNGPNPADPCGP